MKGIRIKRIGVLAIIILTITSILVGYFYIKAGKKAFKESLVNNLQEINDLCNDVYIDVDGSEKKYLDLLVNEEDSFKRGMYSSVLVQIYTVRNDYDKVMYYSNEAINNYKNVPGGEYYAIAEGKYLAWSMLSMSRYADSFRATNSLLEMLNDSSSEVFNKEEILDIEVLMNTIFLIIYSDLEIMDMAEQYYNKLYNMEITPTIYKSRGEKVAFAKYVYSDKIGDNNLRSKYAYECYNIALERDKEKGTDTAKFIVINTVYADLKSGKVDNILERIAEAQGYYSRLGNEVSLGYINHNYGLYYELIGDLHTANDHYKKAINILKDNESNSRLAYELNSYIEFLKNNEGIINEDIDYYYRIYYKIKSENSKNEHIEDLLNQIILVNEELSKSKTIELEKRLRENNILFISSCIMLVLLGIMLARMASAINKKNITEKKLELIANKDYLTGVNTRSYGEKLILQLINENQKFSLAIFDIDNFKNINDTYGHIYGDNVLKVIAQNVASKIRKEDIIIRFGGEEFIIIFVNCTSDQAKKRLDKIRESTFNIEFDNNVHVSFSAGIKEWENTSISQIIDEADQLLYKAKKQGKNRVII